MVIVDFVFRIDHSRVAVFGWAERGARLVFEASPEATNIVPEALRTFERLDIKDLDAHGYVAVLNTDVAGLSALKVGDTTIALDDARLEGDWRPFINGGVDEAFLEYVLLIVDGVVPSTDSELMGALCARLISDQKRVVEKRTISASFEFSSCCPSLGFGLTLGWLLKSEAESCRAVALTVGASTIQRHEVYQHVRIHAGLEGYPDVLEKTGQDGFVGLYQTEVCGQRPAKSVVILRDRSRAYVIGQRPRRLERADFLHQVFSTNAYLVDPPRLTALIDRAAQADAREYPRPNGAMPTISGRSPLGLVLAHDAADADIREVLRVARHRFARPIVYQPQFERRSPAFRQALYATERDCRPSELTIQHAAERVELDQLAKEAAVMLFGRTSALLQLHGAEACIDAVENGAAAAISVYAPTALDLSGEDRDEAVLKMLGDSGTPVVLAARTTAIADLFAETNGRLLMLQARFQAAVLHLRRIGLPVEIMLDQAVECYHGRATLEAKRYEKHLQLIAHHDSTMLRALQRPEAVQ